MTSPVRILGLGGSVRAESRNTRLLERSLEIARNLGAETELADLHTLNLPVFDPDLPHEQQPAQIHRLVERMQWADGFMLASPSYLGSLSGAVKNMFDSLHLGHQQPRTYFEGRPVLLASYGFDGQLNTIKSMRFMVQVMGAEVLPQVLAITGEEHGDSEADLTSPLAQAQMRSAMDFLIRAAEVSRQR